LLKQRLYTNKEERKEKTFCFKTQKKKKRQQQNLWTHLAKLQSDNKILWMTYGEKKEPRKNQKRNILSLMQQN
jgi:hypothetical protein